MAAKTEASSPTKLSPTERLARKRAAARMRQQRCRARKRQAMLQQRRQQQQAAAPASSGPASSVSTLVSPPPPTTTHLKSPSLPSPPPTRRFHREISTRAPLPPPLPPVTIIHSPEREHSWRTMMPRGPPPSLLATSSNDPITHCVSFDSQRSYEEAQKAHERRPSVPVTNVVTERSDTSVTDMQQVTPEGDKPAGEALVSEEEAAVAAMLSLKTGPRTVTTTKASTSPPTSPATKPMTAQHVEPSPPRPRVIEMPRKAQLHSVGKTHTAVKYSRHYGNSWEPSSRRYEAYEYSRGHPVSSVPEYYTRARPPPVPPMHYRYPYPSYQRSYARYDYD